MAALSHRRTKLVLRLRDRKGRRREGLVLVEGRRAVEEALDAGADIRFALVAPRLGRVDGGVALERRLQQATEVETVEDDELSRLADTEHPQGVLAVCSEPGPAAAASLADVGRALVLDGVQDPGNAGALVRAAVAFGLDAVIALEGTVDLWGAKAVRASAGLVFRAAVGRWRADELTEALAARGIALLVADAAGADVGATEPPPAWALAVGNEGHGVRPELRAAGAAVRVAMPGPAESLNAATAGAILLHHLTWRQARD